MDVTKLMPYAKAITAAIGALTITVAAISDGSLDTEEVAMIVTAWATVFGVYQVKNKPETK